jgi:cytochrome c oxidase assembly protein subunit 11
MDLVVAAAVSLFRHAAGLEMTAAARANSVLLRRLLMVALAMFGFGYAMVPLYAKFCEIAGINRDDAQVLARNTQVDASRSVQIQMLADSRDDAGWRLVAPPEAVSAHPGELVEVAYELENLSDRPLTGRAVPSYAPARAAAFIKKIECFCFREQHLAPREKLRLPVLLVLDPALPAEIGVVSLSYVFYPQEGS